MRWRFFMLVVALVLGLAIASVLFLAFRRPDTIRIVRSIEIAAPVEKVFGLIQDFRAFNTWNPWVKMDPEIQLTYRGPQAGAGAVSAWTSKKVGEGSMEIVEVDPPKRVVIRLEFIKPFAATNRAGFDLTPTPSGTSVRWEMEGKALFIQRVMGVFFDVERMMGKNFEDGLADLKRIAER
jgi:uncharacterized protein YndB with AHSA1/START domain